MTTYRKIARWLLGQLKTQLARQRRRKEASLVAIALLTVVVFGLSRYLAEPPPMAPPAGGERLRCDVAQRAIYDGDTVTAHCPKALKIRLWGIDAPEMGQQPWGERSRDALRRLLAATPKITVEVVDHDRYGRTVARLLSDDQDLGLTLVRQGWATVYHRYNDSARYRRVEAEARQARRGIWAEAGSQQDPARWRKVNARSAF